MPSGTSITIPSVQAQARLKVISLGESGVGKSCLIKRYCEDKFVSKYVATIGIDYGVKPVQIMGAGPVKINFFDFASRVDRRGIVKIADFEDS